MKETSSSVISRLQPCERRRAQQVPKGCSGRRFFSKFTSQKQSYAAALHHDMQPQALHTYGRSLRLPVQQHLPQQEIQRTGLSVQAPTSTNNDTLKAATLVQQIITKLSEAVSEKKKIMVITKMVLNLMNKMAATVHRPPRS
jgi:hypothetical protein